MRAYRPASTPETVHVVPRHTSTVFRPTPLNTKSQRAAWIRDNIKWSRTLARTIERHRRCQSKRQKEQHQAKDLSTWLRQSEAQEKAQAEYRAETADQISLACYNCTWSVSLLGLIASGFLFLMLFTNVVQETEGHQLGCTTRCNSVPSITKVSKFSVIFWIAVVVDIISKSAAMLAVENMAILSKALHRADAAYFTCLNEYLEVGIHAGATMASIPLGCDFLLEMRWKCEDYFCLNFALAALAIMSWTFLASTVGAHFLADRCMAIESDWGRISSILSSNNERREPALESDCELLGQSEQDTVDYV